MDNAPLYYLEAKGNIQIIMSTLTVKISDQLEQEMEEVLAEEHLSKSELVRRALTSYIFQRTSPPPFVSALEQAGDLVGCFEGGPEDLSSNPEHMSDFGQV